MILGPWQFSSVIFRTHKTKTQNIPPLSRLKTERHIQLGKHTLAMIPQSSFRIYNAFKRSLHPAAFQGLYSKNRTMRRQEVIQKRYGCFVIRRHAEAPFSDVKLGANKKTRCWRLVAKECSTSQRRRRPVGRSGLW